MAGLGFVSLVGFGQTHQICFRHPAVLMVGHNTASLIISLKCTAKLDVHIHLQVGSAVNVGDSI